MAYTSTALTAAVNGIATAGTYISFHTADPSTTGASEVSGGSYARQPTTWATASNGVRAGSQITASIPASTTVTYWGIWSAVTAGSFLYGGAMPASESFGSAGTLLHTPTISVTN